jgi:hypothetical protein
MALVPPDPLTERLFGPTGIRPQSPDRLAQIGPCCRQALGWSERGQSTPRTQRPCGHVGGQPARPRLRRNRHLWNSAPTGYRMTAPASDGARELAVVTSAPSNTPESLSDRVILRPSVVRKFYSPCLANRSFNASAMRSFIVRVETDTQDLQAIPNLFREMGRDRYESPVWGTPLRQKRSGVYYTFGVTAPCVASACNCRLPPFGG